MVGHATQRWVGRNAVGRSEMIPEDRLVLGGGDGGTFLMTVSARALEIFRSCSWAPRSESGAGRTTAGSGSDRYGPKPESRVRKASERSEVGHYLFPVLTLGHSPAPVFAPFTPAPPPPVPISPVHIPRPESAPAPMPGIVH